MEKTGGKVQMATMNMIDDDGWFRPLASQEGCSFFAEDGQTVTINQPGCVTALETLKKMKDAGILANGDWGAQIQNIKASTVATAFFGGWYEGTIRSNAPDQSGKWGVYPDAGRPERRACGQLGRLIARDPEHLGEPGGGVGLSSNTRWRPCRGRCRC